MAPDLNASFAIRAGGPTITTVTLEEARAKLPQLVGRLAPGEEITITEEGRPVAKIVGKDSAPTP